MKPSPGEEGAPKIGGRDFSQLSEGPKPTKGNPPGLERMARKPLFSGKRGKTALENPVFPAPK